MELHTVQVTNFRSIKDSGVVPIDDIACLVGKNESGKTNFLQALVRLHPAPGQPSKFDVNDDYPRAEATDMEARLADTEYPRPTVVTATYRLDANDLKAVADAVGEGVFAPEGDPPTITATVNYASKRFYPDVRVDEAKAVEAVARGVGLEGSHSTKKTISEFRTALDEIVASEDEGESSKDVASKALAKMAAWPDGSLLQAVMNQLVEREPMYMYFDQYASLPASGNVRELLLKRQNQEALSASEHTFLALIDEAQIDLERASNQDYAALRNGLESASIRISNDLKEYWSQNQRSRIDFDHTYVDIPGEPADSRRDLILMLRVEDTRYQVSTSIARRSSGFIWFFSFMVNFAQIRAQAPDRPLVLLLDEPGTSLHGLAQRDFLKVLDGKLSEHQVLYTTHQPFLVDPDRLDRARPVVEEEDEGTKVRNHAYKVDKDTLFPLQAALGYEIGQTLFVAPNVLLVEGTSDLIYLQLLSRARERKDAAGLDRRWAVTPVGGIDKMDTFVRLFKGQQLNICALVDTVGNKQAKIDKLVKEEILQADEIVKLAEFLEAEDADIEDLFTVAFYLKLVQGVATEDPARGIYAAINEGNLAPQEDVPRITKRIDAALKGFQHDALDHLPPALYFERHQEELLEALDEETLDRAARLFERVNAQLTA
jgi:predicted ATP-dependent endonuclease of OLD family